MFHAQMGVKKLGRYLPY